MEQAGSQGRSAWVRWRSLIVEVGVGIVLGVLFAVWRANDTYEGPMPGSQSVFGIGFTVIGIVLAGLAVMLFARSGSTRRRGLGVLLIAVVSVITWCVLQPPSFH